MINAGINQNSLKSLTVLYVEDDPDVREQLSQYLRRRVGKLLVAENGAEGLDFYRSQQPAMIITDILMPVMDGLAMASEIRETDADIPIVVTTAFENSSYFMRSIEIGVDKYVTKPIDIDLFHDAINKCAYRIKADDQLRLAYTAFEHCLEAILVTDANNTICWVNPAFSDITGYSEAEVIGKNPRLLSSGKQDRGFYQAMWSEIKTKGCWKGEIWNRRKNGEVYAEMLSVSAVKDAAGVTKNYVGLFSDITIMKRNQSQLEYLAHYDALTGLPNRLLLADRLQLAMSQCQRRNRSLAVVFLDLDGFKTINDLHGHHIGDALLIAIALRMKNILREGDTLARLGGDEFVAVLADFDIPRDIEQVLPRLLQAAAEAVCIGNASLQVSASIGVTLYPQDPVDAEQLIRHADQAMYTAKQAGKKRYHLFDMVHA